MVRSNLPFAQWSEVFFHPPAASAVIDHVAGSRGFSRRTPALLTSTSAPRHPTRWLISLVVVKLVCYCV